MTTTFITKSKGKLKKLSAITQQYEVGLYLAFYEGNRCIDQSGLQLFKPNGEKKFHKDLRKKIAKNKDKFIAKESSVI